MNSTPNARYSNLATLFPLGTMVDVILAHKNESDQDGCGAVIYTDGLGVCTREDGSNAFYPWANVLRLVEAGR